MLLVRRPVEKHRRDGAGIHLFLRRKLRAGDGVDQRRFADAFRTDDHEVEPGLTHLLMGRSNVRLHLFGKRAHRLRQFMRRGEGIDHLLAQLIEPVKDVARAGSCLGLLGGGFHQHPRSP